MASGAQRCTTRLLAFLVRVPGSLPESSTPDLVGHTACCVFSERDWHGTVDIYSPSGFSGFVTSGPVPGLREQWHQFVTDRRYVCGYFALHPMLAQRDIHVKLTKAKDLYVLDLTKGISALRDGSDQNVRRSLRTWAKSRISFVEERGALTDFLLRNCNDFLSRKNACSTFRWTTGALKTVADDPNVLMVGAADSLGLCIVLTFARSAFGAEYHLNINVRDGRRYTVPLVFWGLERLAELKTPWLNLGGGIRPGDSIAKAKERYRPVRVPFYAAKEIYDVDRYTTLCREAGFEDVNSPDGYFPKYRIPSAA
jgi:hypothetical protein